MPYTFSIKGQMSVLNTPAVVPQSGDFEFRSNLQEVMVLDNKYDTVLPLTGDIAVAVPFGGVATANAVLLRVLTPGAGKVLATFTHADGTAQILPIDPVLFVLSASSPITAITLQRFPTVPSSVEIFLGQIAV